MQINYFLLKATIANLLLSTLFGINLYAQNLNDNLLIYYPLDGTVQDESINEFDGTNFGAAASEDRNGVQGGCMLFENGAYIDFPDQMKLKPQFPFSFSFWFMATEYNEDQNYSLVSTDMTLDKYYGAFITIVKNTHELLVGFGDGFGFTSVEYRYGKISGEPIELNRWYHLAVVFNSPFDNVVYLDGFKIPLCKSGTGNPQIEYAYVPGSLGRNDHSSIYGNNLSFFTGKMDEFRFWDRALTDDDVELMHPLFNLKKEITICEGDVATLNMPEKDAYTYEWNTGAEAHNLEVKEGGTYIVNVEANGCVTSDTTEVVLDRCISCTNEPGLMQSANSMVCGGSSIFIKEAFSVVDEYSTKAYVLHEGKNFDGRNYLNIQKGNRFFSYGESYNNRPLYISAVVGRAGEDGMPIMDDACTVWTPYGAYVMFFDPIKITKVNETCLKGNYFVDVQVTGGLGNLSPNWAYQLVTDGNRNYRSVDVNELLSFGPYYDEDGFTLIEAHGAKGCKASLTQATTCNQPFNKLNHTLNGDVIKIAYTNKNESIQTIEVYNLNAKQIAVEFNIDRYQGEVRLLNNEKGLFVIKVLSANNEVDHIKLLR